MNDVPFTVVGLGEVLWDMLPTGPQLGGAPANFAHISGLLGQRALIASRVGSDDLGQTTKSRLSELGLPISYLQCDGEHPTSTVQVRLDSQGQAEFEILPNVAWDFLEWTPEWQKLAAACDAVCFGTLAQRSPTSRDTITRFVTATRPDAVRVFDVNLRQHFFSADIVRQSLKLADIVKLNHDELPRVTRLLGLDYRDDQSAAETLLQVYDLDLFCVTRAREGSLLISHDAMDEHPGFPVKVVDTVGAGDAFTAGLVHGHLRHLSLLETNDLANRLGAWVASHSGATPPAGPEGLERALAALGAPH